MQVIRFAMQPRRAPLPRAHRDFQGSIGNYKLLNYSITWPCPSHAVLTSQTQYLPVITRSEAYNQPPCARVNWPLSVNNMPAPFTQKMWSAKLFLFTWSTWVVVLINPACKSGWQFHCEVVYAVWGHVIRLLGVCCVILQFWVPWRAERLGVQRIRQLCNYMSRWKLD